MAIEPAVKQAVDALYWLLVADDPGRIGRFHIRYEKSADGLEFVINVLDRLVGVESGLTIPVADAMQKLEALGKSGLAAQFTGFIVTGWTALFAESNKEGLFVE